VLSSDIIGGSCRTSAKPESGAPPTLRVGLSAVIASVAAAVVQITIGPDSNAALRAAIALASGTTLALTGATTLDNDVSLAGAATLSNSATVTLSGLLSGSSTLTKSGAGTLTVSNSGNSAAFGIGRAHV